MLIVNESQRAGVLDTLSQLPPATSMQIADVAGMDETFVRELLAAMVDAHLVVFHPMTATYQLGVPSTDDAQLETSSPNDEREEPR